MTSLASRTIVVVGGTTGMGRCIVEACLEEGARVVALGDRDPDPPYPPGSAAEQPVPGLVVQIGDARERATLESLADRCVREFGGPDAWIHVAGGSGRRWGDGPLHELSFEGWRRTLELNLDTAFHSNQIAVCAMLERGQGGSVINMGSVLATSPSPDAFATHAYAAAKSALIGLTRTCAAYYAPRDIRFNVVLPGLIDTPMSRRAVESPAIAALLHDKQPLAGGGPGHVRDVVGAVLLLASDRGRWITGQCLAVDGGWSVSEGRHPLRFDSEPSMVDGPERG